MTEPATDAYVEFRGRFTEILRSSADALLSQSVPGFRPQSQPELSAVDTAGVVGFVGSDIRGMFFVGVTSDHIKALRAELYQDWIGELTNQLAGRVKNQLTRFGVSFEVSPPIMLHGDRLSVGTVGAQDGLTYSCLGGECRVWVLLDVMRPVQLKEAQAAEAPIGEGELLLF